MQSIPVRTSGSKDTAVSLIELSDIYRIENRSGSLLVHAASGSYNMDLPMEIAAQWLEPEGFRLWDPANLVNMQRVKDNARPHVMLESAAHYLPVSKKNDLFAKTMPEFFIKVRQALSSAKKTGDTLAVLYVCLDRFKMFNRTLGFETGDRLLKHVGEKLQQIIAAHRVHGYFSGEEAILVMEQAGSLDDVARIARNILHGIQAPFAHERQEFVLTASIGISFYPNDGQQADDLIAYAGAAMELAREKGGNGFQLYQPGLQGASLHSLQLESELREAVERDEFVLHYQPLVKISYGSMYGMEAFVRWAHPTRGMLAPSEFIPLAEETGLIHDLGRLILEKACAQTMKWRQESGKRLQISVNISTPQLLQPGFSSLIESIVSKTGIDPSSLILEINEQQTIRNLAQAQVTIGRLTQMGVRLAIDDFGTGISTLASLKRYRADFLKIDKVFFRDLGKDPANAVIVKTLIRLSRQLNISSLAEGVETEGEFEYLKAMGCDDIQGNYYSTPLGPDEFTELLKKEKTIGIK